MSDISNLYKEDGWYRDIDHNWILEKYGFQSKGRGDLIYNNLRKIIETNDKSKWAYNVFDKCTVLLIQGKRWPDSMEPPKVDKKYDKFRAQNNMSRDPWVMYYAACIYLDKREFINLKPPKIARGRLMYRPNLWELRKALLGKKNKYVFWRSVNDAINALSPKKEFVEILEKYRNWSYDRRK